MELGKTLFGNNIVNRGSTIHVTDIKTFSQEVTECENGHYKAALLDVTFQTEDLTVYYEHYGSKLGTVEVTSDISDEVAIELSKIRVISQLDVRGKIVGPLSGLRRLCQESKFIKTLVLRHSDTIKRLLNTTTVEDVKITGRIGTCPNFFRQDKLKELVVFQARFESSRKQRVFLKHVKHCPNLSFFDFRGAFITSSKQMKKVDKPNLREKLFGLHSPKDAAFAIHGITRSSKKRLDRKVSDFFGINFGKGVEVNVSVRDIYNRDGFERFIVDKLVLKEQLFSAIRTLNLQGKDIMVKLSKKGVPKYYEKTDLFAKPPTSKFHKPYNLFEAERMFAKKARWNLNSNSIRKSFPVLKPNYLV